MRFLSILALSLICTLVQAQPKPILQDEYTWSDTTDWQSLVPEDFSGDAYTLLFDRTMEYNYGGDGNLYGYYFMHKVVYLNSEQAVEDQNKIYLSLDNAIELMDYNARVISADGKETLLGKDALQEGTTEDEVTYNYFAIAGAEVGSVVDYYYLIKKYPSYSGSYMVMQGSYPTLESRFRIISPWNLVFKAFPINGYNEIEEDTSYAERNVLIAQMKDLPKVPQDESANNDANTMKVIYQLDDNLYTGSKNIYNYGTLSQNIFERFRGENAKKENKKVAKFMKPAELEFSRDLRDRVFRIENYIKENVTVINANDDRLQDIEFILENNVANEFGINKLFFRALQLNDIKFEIVLTCNRYDLRFEPEIETYAFLTDYLFYFPDLDDYVMPSARFYRIGVIPMGYLHNHGLFIKELDIAGIVTGVGKVRFIDAYRAEHSYQDMWLDVSFNEDLSKITVDLKQEMTGFNATPFQPYFDYIPEENMDEFKEGIVKGINENMEIESIDVENGGDEYLMKFPLIVKSKWNSEEFMELAGEKVLFKMGELIGPQVEMYQEEKRTLPVETAYNHRYHREISFEIPEGYACNNLNDINLNIVPFTEDEAAGFTSTFSQEGNTVTVIVEEYYDRIDFSVEEFEDYRAVINAAADFNKIVLVFQKS